MKAKQQRVDGALILSKPTQLNYTVIYMLCVLTICIESALCKISYTTAYMKTSYEVKKAPIERILTDSICYPEHKNPSYSTIDGLLDEKVMEKEAHITRKNKTNKFSLCLLAHRRVYKHRISSFLEKTQHFSIEMPSNPTNSDIQLFFKILDYISTRNIGLSQLKIKNIDFVPMGKYITAYNPPDGEVKIYNLLALNGKDINHFTPLHLAKNVYITYKENSDNIKPKQDIKDINDLFNYFNYEKESLISLGHDMHRRKLQNCRTNFHINCVFSPVTNAIVKNKIAENMNMMIQILYINFYDYEKYISYALSMGEKHNVSELAVVIPKSAASDPKLGSLYDLKKLKHMFYKNMLSAFNSELQEKFKEKKKDGIFYTKSMCENNPELRYSFLLNLPKNIFLLTFDLEQGQQAEDIEFIFNMFSEIQKSGSPVNFILSYSSDPHSIQDRIVSILRLFSAFKKEGVEMPNQLLLIVTSDNYENLQYLIPWNLFFLVMLNTKDKEEILKRLEAHTSLKNIDIYNQKDKLICIFNTTVGSN
ncbi:hypothetical protein NEPAR06_1183 [Nematocida parisii]|uniref:uncharacterized protein n=1 Tax=Nematocida parisii (strain ERTm1 / ATCC PRA-289) TaxID=881290 RepID=UPI000264B3C9|nr:uncharacterized protein NEPG_00663 [Nematocida parisii ERTm1]EIJ93998.1 hypothetical protein NEPG_00663 [Nematocida parisii ERTm1]KAI5144668.1 hypothetical protein NEPAR07_1205 [Nematocida parisii]KAI5154508.1 hypothetical protein NEPAR06_1183 [Nematocida parisii]KAI5157512.1 hypothetical protein NEPAR05_1345 [Nematocida parisii]|eukprot:XP_013058494.1 hypothetical protein NEPG_00663 [Nematocida parisii ERTm1]